MNITFNPSDQSVFITDSELIHGEWSIKQILSMLGGKLDHLASYIIRDCEKQGLLLEVPDLVDRLRAHRERLNSHGEKSL